MTILTEILNYDVMVLDMLEGIVIFLGIIFLSYTIPRLITFAICTSIYEARINFLKQAFKQFAKKEAPK